MPARRGAAAPIAQGAWRTDDELLDTLRRVALTVDGPLRIHDYNESRRDGDPSVGTIARRFGSWPAALEAAGITPHPRAGVCGLTRRGHAPPSRFAPAGEPLLPGSPPRTGTFESRPDLSLLVERSRLRRHPRRPPRRERLEELALVEATAAEVALPDPRPAASHERLLLPGQPAAVIEVQLPVLPRRRRRRLPVAPTPHAAIFPGGCDSERCGERAAKALGDDLCGATRPRLPASDQHRSTARVRGAV